MNRNSNIIGRKIAKLRYERNWSQAILVAKLQLQGNETIRAVVANIETRRSSVTDKQLAALAKAFGISVAELFPARSQYLFPTALMAESAISDLSQTRK